MRPYVFCQSVLLLILLLGFNSASASAAAFERPPGLEPDIGFWRRVYSEINTSQGFIHDNARLDIVYATIDFKPGESKRSRQRRVEKAKSDIRDTLVSLAKGKRDNLSAEQKRVLALWGGNPDARELRAAADRLRFQLGQADKFRAGLIRSGRWEAFIRKTFRDMGLPEELAALPHVESSFHPGARSHIGASGLWQFTRDTGRRFMRVDHVVDERLDPFLATAAAGRLLAQNYAVTGTWPLALTAYNHGASSLRRAKASLGTSNIETIVRNYQGRRFGFASRNFYVAFLAALDISRDAERYFGPLDRDRPDNSRTVRLPEYFNIDTLASSLGVNETVLRQHNPALLDTVWSGEKHVPRDYRLRLPSKVAAVAETRLNTIPDSERFATQTPDLSHKVRRGDTISGIAAYYRVSVNQLLAMNGLRNRNMIRAGQVLLLPGAAREGTPVALVATAASAGPTPGAGLHVPENTEDKTRLFPEPSPTEDPVEVAVAAGISEAEESIGQLAAVPESLTADPSDYSVAADGRIIIQPEETLGHYAEWLGIRASQLRRLNGMRYGTPLVVGKRLKLDFSQIQREEFESLRLAYHVDIQTRFFSQYKITGSRPHVLKPGESFWALAQANPVVPVWLLHQFNPDLNLSRLRAGTTIAIPVLEEST